MLDPDVKEGLDSLIEAADGAGPEWAEDLLGYIEEDLAGPARQDMAKDGITDADEQDAVAAVVTVKALYLAYREALTDIEDPNARAYLQAAIEKAGAVPLGEQVGFQADKPAQKPARGVVAPLAPVAPAASPRPPVPPSPAKGFTPPKLG